METIRNSKIEALKKKTDEAICNLNGMDAIKVFFTIMTVFNFKKVEKRWQVVEKKALALAYAVKQFKYHIESKTTNVFIDQRAVLAIKSPKENQSKLRRYQMALAAYNLNIYYKEGKANVLADMFSRNPEPKQPLV
uniref:RT_RNaseH domain-containing protein n=1 Tax=Strongyloides papillosus TaxID=174720 RepID=A0A0N5BZI6_STREA